MLLVLGAIAVVAIMVNTLMRRSSRALLSAGAGQTAAQSFYLAESGIAWGLYRARSAPSGGGVQGLDSAVDTGLTGEKTGFPPLGQIGDFTEALSFPPEFGERTGLPDPEISADLEGDFWTITSSSEVAGHRTGIQARFGKRPRDPLLDAALVLTGSDSAYQIDRSRIEGNIVLRRELPGLGFGVLVMDSAFHAGQWMREYRDARSRYLESELHSTLGWAEPGSPSGNGYLDASRPPDFAARPDQVWPLGDVTLSHFGRGCWELRGPGRIVAHGDIRVEGCVSLHEVELWSGRSVMLTDSVSGGGVAVYARSNFSVLGRCRLQVRAVAGENILLGEDVVVERNSLLLSVGANPRPTGATPDTGAKNEETATMGYGIQLTGQARASGILVAGGHHGHVNLVDPDTRLEGILLANHSAMINGTVAGTVLAGTLRCDTKSDAACMGDGRISRPALENPPVWPVDLGPGGAGSWAPYLVSWDLIEATTRVGPGGN